MLDEENSNAELLTETPVIGELLTPTELTNSVTATPIQNAPLLEDGPWFIFRGSGFVDDTPYQNLFLINWDGTGLTTLLSQYFIWQFKVQPDIDGKSGEYVATIVSDDYYDLNYRLLLLHLPEGKIIKEVLLVPPNPTLDVSFILTNWNSIAWSPDGKNLAFSGIEDGERLDVFTYSLENDSIKRLTYQQHRNQAATPTWSPDSRHIAFESSSYQQIGLLAAVDSVWLVSIDGGYPVQIVTAENWENDLCFGVYINQWLSDFEIAVNCPLIGNKATNSLTVLNIENGITNTLVPDNQFTYWGAQYAPELDTWLMSFTERNPTYLAGNMYFVKDGIWEFIGEATSPFITWWPEREQFIVNHGIIDAQGNYYGMDLPPFEALLSPDNSYWVFPAGVEMQSAYYSSYYSLLNNDNFWIGGTDESLLSTEMPLWALEWSGNNRSILLRDHKSNELYIAIAPDFKPFLISTLNSLSLYGPWNGLYPPEP